jgi:ABC-type glycerol-3-phosphate transport system substrate-binding protein
MKGSSLSRRKFLMQAAAVGAGMALAACAPAGTPAAPQPTAAGETPAPAPKEAVTIEIWNANWGELYNDLMKRIGDEFEAEHPEIKLQWSFNDEWQEKWLTAVAAGIPPDCGYTNWEGLATLAHGKAVIALDDYFAASGIKPEDFVTSMIKNAT